MITGDEFITKGQAYFNNINSSNKRIDLKTNIKQVKKNTFVKNLLELKKFERCMPFLEYFSRISINFFGPKFYMSFRTKVKIKYLKTCSFLQNINYSFSNKISLLIYEE